MNNLEHTNGMDLGKLIIMTIVNSICGPTLTFSENETLELMTLYILNSPNIQYLKNWVATVIKNVLLFLSNDVTTCICSI